MEPRLEWNKIVLAWWPMAATRIWNSNRKSYMSFRLVPKSVTLNDLERRDGHYFALFHLIFVYDVVVKQLLDLPRDQNLRLTVCDHINTICAIIQRLFGQNKRRQWPPLHTVVAYAHVCWWVSCSIGQVHCVTQRVGQASPR